MTDFDGPPYDERFTSDDEARQETYLDGVVAAANAINSVLEEHGLQRMIYLKLPRDYTEETLHEESEKYYRSAGELALGADLKARMELLIKEAQLREQD